MAEKKRGYTPWEIMMIGEWVALTFPDVEWATNVRLGPIQPRNSGGRYTQEEMGMLGVWRRRVDAIVYLPDRLLLIEAVLRSDPGKLSILQLYEMLVPQTPELAPYRHLPVEKVFLYVIEDPTLNILARRQGILPIQFVPSFFDEWFEKLARRKKRTPRSDFLREE